MATIVDVARLAGVGTTTVTKVLAGRYQVSEPTRRRVVAAVAALDYHPSAAGRMLRTGVTRVLGVVMPPPSIHPFNFSFFPRVLEGIGDRAAEHGYDILWITTDRATDPGRPYSALFKSKRVDGVIDVCIYVGDPRIEGLRASGHPFVLIGRPEDASLPHVDAANREAGMAVGQAFVQRGYHRVAYVGIADSPASLDRLSGLQHALAEFGQALHPRHQVLIKSEKESLGLQRLGTDAMRSWLDSGDVPRAVMTSTDTIAYGVLEACREVGLRVPEDVALVGFDDEPSSRLLNPQLASVEQPMHALGYEAAGLLLEVLSGGAPSSLVRVLPTRLIERASLGPAPHVDSGLLHSPAPMRTIPGAASR